MIPGGQVKPRRPMVARKIPPGFELPAPWTHGPIRHGFTHAGARHGRLGWGWIWHLAQG